MKMGRLEKKFVNSKKHGEKNLEIVERVLGELSLSKAQKVLEIGCGVGVVAAHLVANYQLEVGRNYVVLQR